MSYEDLPQQNRTGVKRYWAVPILGPTSTWLLRRFAVEFDASPDGFSLDATDAARSIGIGTRGVAPVTAVLSPAS